MAFCRKCGSELTEGQLFCTKCGEPVEVMNNNNTSEPAPAPVEKAKLNVGMLVWSIINMLCCGTVVGIVALVFTIMADNQPIEKANGYLKVAKILNIVATALAAVIVVIYIIWIIFVLVFGFSIAAGGMYY